MEELTQIVQTTLNSFDFTYCLLVNVLTYIIIKTIDEFNKDKEVKTWCKRIILLSCILFTGVVYWLLGKDLELLINSAILAPVAWSWIFKPAFKKIGIDYKRVDNIIDK